MDQRKEMRRVGLAMNVSVVSFPHLNTSHGEADWIFTPQVESAYAHHGVPPAKKTLQTKPAKRVSLFHEDKFHYVDVVAEDLQGEIIESIGPTGLHEDLYYPIDGHDKLKGVNAAYLQLCPPELQRSLKLRSAGLTRRRAELRVAKNWAALKKGEIAGLKVELSQLFVKNDIRANQVEMLMKKMDEQPLSRAETKRFLKQELEKLQEGVRDCSRREQELQVATEHLLHLREVMVQTKYKISRAEEAHDRDCERIHVYVENHLAKDKSNPSSPAYSPLYDPASPTYVGRRG
jgi:hypothetical protein